MPCVGTQQFIVQTNIGFGNTNMPAAIVRALIDQSEPYPNDLVTRKQRASSIGTCTSSSEQGVPGLLRGFGDHPPCFSKNASTDKRRKSRSAARNWSWLQSHQPSAMRRSEMAGGKRSRTGFAGRPATML